MSLNAVIKAISIIILFGVFVVATSYTQYKNDPFGRYKNFVKKPLDIMPQNLTHYGAEEKLIRDKLKLDLSPRERSMLAGLHWLIVFADNDKNFDFIFPDFILLLNTLSNSKDRIHQQEIVDLISQSSLKRAQKKMSSLFEKNEESRGVFIGILQLIHRHPQFKEEFFQFYKNRFGPILDTTYEKDEQQFIAAVQEPSYGVLFGYLVNATFLHYYLGKDKNSDVALPPDRLPQYLKQFENFEYVDEQDPKEFRALGYLVTHVVYALTNYGEFDIKKDVNQSKAQVYIESSLEKTRQFGDFDLLAEYVQCLKLFSPNADSRVPELEQFIYSLQRPDGSWGSEEDFKTDSYTAIHPTGAALMALNQ